MKQFNLFIPLTKVDEEKRCVYGIATAESVDKSGEVFDYNSSLPYYKEWSGEIAKASGGKSLGNVREMHTNIAAGKLTQIEFNDEKKQIEVCAKIVNDSTWEKVLEGVLTGFSHGGEYIKTWKDPDNAKITRYTARPSEISVVDNPCLGAATFELLRADGATEMRKFKTQENPMTEPAIDGKAAKPKTAPVQKWEASDGKTFLSKRECEAHELELETATNGVAAPALNALAELEKAVAEKEGLEKKDYSDEDRAKMAEEGHALPDGSFPIANKKDLENAIHAYGRAKDKAKAKAHIEARAKALDAEDMLPEDWDGSTKKEEKSARIASLKKSLDEAFDSQCAIEALCTIEFLLMSEMNEDEDEPEQLADLKAAIDRLKSFVASEIMENAGDMEGKADGGDLQKAGARHSAADKGQLTKAKAAVDEASDHLEDAKKAHGKVGEAHDGMRKAMGCMADCMKSLKGGDLSKFDAEALEKYRKEAEDGAGKMADHMDAMETHLDKAEKHHGKMAKSHDGIEAAHDVAHHALKAVGAMDGNPDDEAEKAAHAEMKKTADELTLVKADLTATQDENAELKKALDKVNAEVPAMIQPLIERIKKLEAQPLPAKGAVFPVAKGHEAPVEPGTPVEAPSFSTYGASPAEMREILKLIN